ncbi:cytochrome P450 [Streptomyces sp. NPDC059894]|uniref:cytochrome P450 n=1 Tax=unclassified Streptomyces TaxID=2593676 RepID=UPI003667ED3E
MVTADESHDEAALPYRCPAHLGEPPQFPVLRQGPGIDRLPTSTGDSAWLVTSHDGVRTMCGDPRVGKSHADPSRAPRLWDAALMEPQSGHADEFAVHSRWRHTLSRHFSSRRVAELRQHVEEVLGRIVADRLAEGPPMDVRTGLAQPFAATVICDLLGLPHALRPALVAWSDTARAHGMAREAAARRGALRQRIDRALDDVRAEARDSTADDTLLQDLALARPEAHRLTREEWADAVLDVFLAGYDTISTRIVHGTAYLLDHPEQLRALTGDPALIPGAVEEIFRLAVPGGSWIPRYARTDIPLPHATVAAGDLIVLSFQSANRDERVFPDAGRFDIHRHPNPHIAFGHGTFYCLGAALARLELGVYLAALARFPGLGTASPGQRHVLAEATVTGGLEHLLTTWDTDGPV